MMFWPGLASSRFCRASTIVISGQGPKDKPFSFWQTDTLIAKVLIRLAEYTGTNRQNLPVYMPCLSFLLYAQPYPLWVFGGISQFDLSRYPQTIPPIF